MRLSLSVGWLVRHSLGRFFNSRIQANMFVHTKMRLKQGTKIELQREICQICQISFASDSMQFPCDFRDLKKTRDGPTTDGRTDPLIEMRRRI